MGHTFSFYLRGGEGTWRVDGAQAHGWPGAVCVMPQGQSSVWRITRPFVFLHLYLPDDELRRSFAETFDRDARRLELAERTYVEPEQLAMPFKALLAAIQSDDPACADAAAVELMATLLASGRFANKARLPLTGGLSPRHRTLLCDFIEANLDQTLRLRELSTLVGLSEFHLQRSFRETCGVSPQRWIAHRRTERAKRLIRDGEPLAQVAAACGFSSQSHLSRSFRDGTGVTPGAFRRAMA
ncbi:AraC family transcriptional regulator [Tropicimonas sp. TH_r6]|uniref:AraC family transcriptional regulator n=1 Tax=Tropicimonas sp. TH_r6 TaxID=3082085 RepID=UPI002952FEEF|nr:AraC family transcriptional regulator [Tropicimonas sp. TH_r6]MDV7143780.1 AraC family transcriptional regulator [Tropicimonas sp. TH_r6]